MIESKERSKIFQENCELITENINELIIIINQVGEIESINNLPLIKSLGYKSDDLIGSSWLNYVHSEDLETAINVLENCTEGKPVVQELRLKHANGIYKNFKFYCKLTRNFNESKGFLIILKPEQRLKESSEFYKTILDGVINGVWVTNKDDIIFFTNKGMETIAGIPTAQIVDVRVLKDFPESTLKYFRSYYLKAKEALKPVYYDAVPVKTPGGRQSYQSGWLIPKTQNGKYDGMICTVEEVTERIEYEQKLKESKAQLVKFNKELEQKVEERTSSLKESEEKFRTITEQSLMGIAILQDDRFRYVNKQIADIFGYTPEEMKNWEKFEYAKLIHSEDREMALEQARRKQLGIPGAVIHYQFRGITKKGSVRWLEIYSKSIRYRDSIADLITIVDITDKKEAEKKLKDSEEKHRTLIDSISDIIFEIDLDGKIIYLSPQTTDMLGYRPDQLINQISFAFIHRDDQEKVLENHNYVINSGEIGSVEFRIRHKKGHFISVSSRSQLIKKDNEKRIVGLFRDVTERNEIKEKVHLEREKAELYLNLVNVLIVALDRDGNILMINQKGRDILGWNEGELIGKNWFENSLPLVERDKVYSYYNQLMKGTIEVKPLYENSVITKNGEERLIAWSTLLIRDLNGNITGVLSSGEDITERKKAEQELRKSEERLKYLASSGPTVIYTAKASGDYGRTFLSENVKDLTGYDPDDFINNSELWINNIHPEDKDLVLSRLSKISKKKSIGYEYRLKFKNRIYHWMRDESKLITDDKGNPVELIGSWSDITWSKKSEEKIQYQAKLVENVSDAIISTDLNFNIITWNKAAESIYGWEAGETIGKSIVDIIPSEYSDGDTETARKQLLEEGFWNGEIIQPHKEGTLINILASVSTIKDLTGKPIGIVAINRNITKRKKAEEKMRESEKRLTNLIEAVPVGITMTTPEGKNLESNSHAYKVFGYESKNEFLEVPVLELYDDPNERERFLELLENGLVKDFEVKFKRKDGSSFWGSLTSIAQKAADQTFFINTFQDITERKIAEEELKNKKATLESIFRAAPTGIGVVINRKIIQVNDRFCELVGYQREELIDKSARMVYPSDEDYEFVGKVKYAQIEKYGTGTVETIFQQKDGSIIDILLSSTPINPNDLSSGVTFTALDITKSKKTEQKLKESEKRYKHLAYELEMILDHLPCIVVYKDTENNILRVNKFMADAHNLKKDDMEGKSSFEFYPYEEAQAYWEDDLEVVKDKKPKFNIVEPWETLEGRRWVNTSKIPYIDEDGEVKGIIAIAFDITDRMKAEQELKVSEEEYRNISNQYKMLLESITDAVYALNRDWEYILVNKNAEKIVNMPIENLLGNKIFEVFPGIKKTLFFKTYETVMNSGKAKRVIESFNFPDGRMGYYEVSVYPITEGILCIAKDVSEEKEIEQKLKESEEKFRNIAEQTSLGLLIQQEGFIKFANSAVADMSEYFLHEINNWSIEDMMKIIHKEDLPLINAKLKILEGDNFDHSEQFECRLITKSGNMKWLEIIAKPIIYLGKKAIFASLIDITAKKKLEDELKEISRLKSELLSRTSHELKTPLVSIKGYADLLLTHHYEELDFYTISILHEIKQGCSRLETLIKDLLETSKLESGEIELNKAEDDLAFLIRFCVRDLKGLVETRNHELILDIKDKMITYFEKEKIYEVLMNLISNAIKYTPTNGKITISSKVQNGNYVISVQDTGIGLTDEEKAKIFKKFGKIERYGKGLDVVSEGSGLGLYISKKIIELHKGNIWVESEGRKKGSIFYFSLPIIKN